MKFNKTEQLTLVASLILIFILIAIVLVAISGDSQRIGSIFGIQLSSSSESNSNSSDNIVKKYSEYEKDLSKYCVNIESFVENYTPDQYYIDQYLRNNNVTNFQQALYKFTIENKEKINSDNSFLSEYNELEKAGLIKKNYNTFETSDDFDKLKRLELVDIFETSNSMFKEIDFREFVHKYYCGQLKAAKLLYDKKNNNELKILYSKNGVEDINQLFKLKLEQYKEFENIDNTELEKKVYSQNRLNEESRKFDYYILFEQFQKISKLY